MSQKILLIEDEPDIRKTLEYNLSREGFDVACASSLSEGKNYINADQFSLILLDLMLPDGSGLDLCRELKSDPEQKSTPIIILTAKDDEVDKVVGFELGANDYVTKPFSVRELIVCEFRKLIKECQAMRSITNWIYLDLAAGFHSFYGSIPKNTLTSFKLIYSLIAYFISSTGEN